MPVEQICGVGNKLIFQQTVDNFGYARQLQQALTYLDRWFNFSESSVASVMSQIAFSKIPTFQNMMNASTLLGLVETKSVFESIVSQSTASVCVTQKWQQYFTVCRDSAVTGVGLPVNGFRIVSAALSIPGSIAFCERVFLSNECKVEGEEE